MHHVMPRDLSKPEPVARRRSLQRARQVEWLNWISERSGHSYTQIARASGLDPSTLTDLRLDEKNRLLSESTLALIERQYQVPPIDRYKDAPGFAEDAVHYEGDRHPLTLAGETSENIDPWTFQSDALEALNIAPGDILLVDLSRPHKDKDIVCAQLFTGEMTARTIFRQFRQIGPIQALMTAYHDRRRDYFNVVGMDDLTIKGVVVGIIRKSAF